MKPRPQLRPASGKIQVSIEDETQFLNVDLDLESPTELDDLIAGLVGTIVLYQSSDAPYIAHLELADDFEENTPHSVIESLLEVIEGLDADRRRTWLACSRRTFNVGIQGGLEPASSEYSVPAHVLERIASVSADLVWTVYGTKVNTLV